jgi:transaldolase
MSTTEVTDVNPNLRSLAEAGTSPWLDLLGRSLVESGELARMIAESGHQDGFVSLEVAADLAHDSEKSINGARDFWKRVNRPNVMIKIPGTPEGVPAIEQAIYEGININVTLLFSVEAYEKVADAYLNGLERRLNEDLPLDVASVASFFVSRIDSSVDKRLEGTAHEDLKGTAAIANARNAYRSFKRIFSGPRWEPLHHAGAHVQRPLWASTGVKDDAYRDTMYVEDLVGAHTVNTMPQATLDAVADHGRISGPTVEHNPEPALAALRDAGIDLAEVTDELLVDGVKKFEDAMTELLDGIEEKRGRPSAG